MYKVPIMHHSLKYYCPPILLVNVISLIHTTGPNNNYLLSNTGSNTYWKMKNELDFFPLKICIITLAFLYE